MSYRHPPTSDFRKLFRNADRSGKLSLVLSSCFGIGRIPAAPGTFGTLAAVPLAVGLSEVGPVSGAFLLFFFLLLAVWTSDRSARVLQNADPPEVVIDEMAGLLSAMFLLPATGIHLCLAFILFRGFDIAKPFPIRRLERLPGGVGIVLDDLLAGAYANLCVRIAVPVLF